MSFQAAMFSKGHRLLALLTWTAFLSGCHTLPGGIPLHEVEPFTPLPAHLRAMNEVKLRWDVREDVVDFCARTMKMGPERAYLTPPIACAVWNSERRECTIITDPRPSHVALGHELRHCFEGHFHP